MTDWVDAGDIMDTSDAVRGSLRATIAKVRQDADATADRKASKRAVAVAGATQTAVINRYIAGAETIRERVEEVPGSLVSEVRRKIRRLSRDEFDNALEHALESEWIREVEETGQGRSKRSLHPGAG